MLIIDRYVLRQFLQTFVICFCSLMGLYVVIDGMGHLDDFIKYSRDHGNLLWVIGEYYAYQSLSFFDATSGILLLISAMFTVTWIQRHNELTALQAAGIAKSRVVKPIIVAVLAVILVSIANRELVIPIPAVRNKLGRTAQDLSGSSAQELRPRYDNDTEILLKGSQTFADKQRIHKPNFLLPTSLDQYGKQLSAEDAYYQTSNGERPGGYLLVGVEQPKSLDRQPSLALRDTPIILTPRDYPTWLKPGECFVVSGVGFEQLEGNGTWRQFSSTAELIRGLRNRSMDYGADVRVAIHGRLVQPLLDITLLFLGLPLVLSRENRNMFLAIGLCIATVAVFMLVVLGCQSLGSSLVINAALAAWLPLIIFVPWAVGLSEPLLQ